MPQGMPHEPTVKSESGPTVERVKSGHNPVKTPRNLSINKDIKKSLYLDINLYLILYTKK
jgi:hypothetical protein